MREKTMRTFFLFLCIFLVSSCQNNAQISNEHAVYDSVFAFMIKDAKKPVVIARATGLSSGSIENKESLYELKFIDLEKNETEAPPVSLMNEFYKINLEPMALTWSPVMVNVDQWLPYEPNKIGFKISHYQVSKVAISENQKQALVNITHKCPMCGGSFLIYLEKKGKLWMLKSSSTLWVS